MRDMKSILKEQVEELNKLLELKEKRIQELEFLLSTRSISSSAIIRIEGGCQHEYPNPWMSITAPSCKKCGQSAATTSLGYIDTSGGIR